MGHSNAAVFHFKTEEPRSGRGREHEYKLCSTCTFISTPLGSHAVRHHLPWFVAPDTACWTCKRQYGSSGQLKKHVDEERIKSDLEPHVDQDPPHMFGQEHVVEWCELESTGSGPHGEWESGRPVVLGQGICYQ